MMVQSHHPHAPTTRRTWIFSSAFGCSTPTSQQSAELYELIGSALKSMELNF